MPLGPDLISPIKKSDGRRTVVEIHDVIRDLILSGQLEPDTVLSQVELSRLLGTSRTPVREALRMLQEEGLVGAEPNFRNRVLGFDPTDIEALYMKRIVLESLGVALTVQRMGEGDIAELGNVLDALEGEESHTSFPTWLKLHRDLHRMIIAKAGDAFVADVEVLELRSERYQSAYKGAHLPGWWQRGEVEHREIYEAMASRNASLAAELVAKHLARTALELLAALAPEYDTSRLREGLRFAIAAASAADG